MKALFFLKQHRARRLNFLLWRTRSRLVCHFGVLFKDRLPPVRDVRAARSLAAFSLPFLCRSPPNPSTPTLICNSDPIALIAGGSTLVPPGRADVDPVYYPRRPAPRTLLTSIFSAPRFRGSFLSSLPGALFLRTNHSTRTHFRTPLARFHSPRCMLSST